MRFSEAICSWSLIRSVRYWIKQISFCWCACLYSVYYPGHFRCLFSKRFCGHWESVLKRKAVFLFVRADTVGQLRVGEHEFILGEEFIKAFMWLTLKYRCHLMFTVFHDSRFIYHSTTQGCAMKTGSCSPFMLCKMFLLRGTFPLWFTWPLMQFLHQDFWPCGVKPSRADSLFHRQFYCSRVEPSGRCAPDRGQADCS